MQLIATGAQDVYLTGNPQVTFFKVVYRRHTNFSMENIEQVFNGQAGFGQRLSCTLSRNGDLVHSMYLQVVLPKVDATAANAEFRWVDYIGEALIKTIDLEIGGQRVDKHYGDWLHIWNELTLPHDKKTAYYEMIGHVPRLNRVTSPQASQFYDSVIEGDSKESVVRDRRAAQVSVTPQTTLYIPLQFWFNRNPGLALPLIALQYHEVTLHVEFENKDKVCYASGNVTVPDIVQSSLLVDYIYLDTEERRRFAQVPHEYLVEQLQFTGDESTTNTNAKIKLNFNHPCKELIWVVQPETFSDCTTAVQYKGCQSFNYSVDWDIQHGVDATPDIQGDTPQITLDFFNSVLAENGTDVSNRYPTITWRVQDGDIVDEQEIIGSIYDSSFDRNLMIVSPYAGRISRVFDSTLSGTEAADETPYTIATVAEVCSFYEDNEDVLRLGIVPRRNPVLRAKLQLNGHDRFMERDGKYFNYVQPFQHHTNTPDVGINVYSFALKPEEHQPTGTCNMSRIDNATLNLSLVRDAVTGRAARVRVYATNYNVLRITSGMGALAYSN